MAKLKVLFVDDDASIQEVMRVRIGSWGYELVQAFGGKQALEMLKSEKPDAVVLDNVMPEMGGIDTLKAIRNINKSIPVIIFTAYPGVKDMKEFDSLNISAFIPKLSAYTESQSALRSALQMIEKGLNAPADS